MAVCPHLAEVADLRPPRPSDPVYREDCTLCFDSSEDPAGLDVCLHCFNGGCAGDRAHSTSHAHQFSHPLALHIQRTRKRKQRGDDGEPPEKISKLEIKAETDADRWDTQTEVRCLECGLHGLERQASDVTTLATVIDGVMKANTFSQAEEVKAWELELTSCEHVLCLEQKTARQIASGDLGQCTGCELKENLWLCLTCGNLGCGRKQMGGLPGNSHARAHGDATGHPVAVKLGSITAEGNADIYCYHCDEERIDPELVAHLANWGIDLAGRVKTEKSLGEMQLEHNLSHDFSMTTEGGKQMQPLFGPGLTGLRNLGNSCYLASVLQSLFANPEFAQRYYRPNEPIPPSAKPAEDLETQLRKLADGLLSGRYSVPDPSLTDWEHTNDKPYQAGITPAMLKHLIGRGHAEFSTMRQQDSFELLLHLLKLVSRSQASARSTYPAITDPVSAFRFTMEQRLRCDSCHRVRYRRDEMENLSVAVPITRLPPDPNNPEAPPAFEPVTLLQCLSTFTAPESVTLTCPACNHNTFTKQTLFATFPTILALNARRFEIVNWVPTKQDVPVIVPDAEPLDLEPFRSRGPQSDEELLPEDEAGGAGAKAAFVPNETALATLVAMGFPRVRCEKALHATGNSDAEVAMGWLFEHMDDADIDLPLDLGGGSGGAGSGSGAVVDEEKIENLQNMGFSAPQARQALKETDGDVERAVDWLFSHPDAEGDFGESEEVGVSGANGEAKEDTAMVEDTKPAKFGLSSIVCHKGSSIHAGHYVAFVRKEEGWVLFNDEKVALGGDVDEMKKFAYIYFFRREEAE